MIPRTFLLRATCRQNMYSNTTKYLQRSYANSADPSSSPSRVPWILATIGAIGVGGYITFMPADKKTQAKEAVHEAKAQARDKVDSKTSEIREKVKKLDDSRRPKDNVDKDSEAGHQKASETNEHKVRHGVFSGKDFDNHDCKHTNDPGKDFEELKQNK